MVFVQLDAAIVGMMTNVIIVITVNMIVNTVTDLFRAYTPICFGGRAVLDPCKNTKRETTARAPICFCFFYYIL